MPETTFSNANPLKVKVLLVDDEAEFSRTLAQRLTLKGMETHTASDGETALASLEARPMDVVVLDLMLPGLTGLEVLRAVRASFATVQVILLTGAGSVKDAMEGMRAGAFDYLEKPVDIDVLVSKIHEAARANARQRQ